MMRIKCNANRVFFYILMLVSIIFLSGCASISKIETGSDDQILFIGDDIAIAETAYGKVQGFILRGICHFRGIPYGADTSGKNRFMPPQKPELWEDVFRAVWWGNSAPQNMEKRYANRLSAFRDQWNYDDVSEDCLNLNIWTPSIDEGRKRPVLVWFHGGGYSSGNSIEQDGYKGENLSRKGNIVFVSVNHRLGPLGFSDLSSVGGSKYAYSGNVGALDMVASLEWIHENISNFGGDPHNVTIIGQSGGGAKVCTILAMPQAEGLVHKAVPLSGSTVQAMDQEYSCLVGEYILKEAGLTAAEVDKLQEMPWKEYLSLARRAAGKCAEENAQSRRFRRGFGPVADGVNLPKGTYFSESDGLSSDVPMLLCSTFHEWSMTYDRPEMEDITVEQAKKMLAERAGRRGGLGEKASEVYDAYAHAFPDAKPIELVTMIGSNRKSLIRTANAKVTQKSPVYVAWFGWNPPLFDNRIRAFHCVDICFWFYNTDLMLSHTGGGARPRKLSDKMSGALLRFMVTGNPNGGGLPWWPAYTIENGETMILNDVCKVKNDPDREGRNLIPD